jgi:hypothetical protein
MNTREAIEGFIVLYFAMLVGAYAKHRGLLFIINVIAAMVSIVTNTLGGYTMILEMSAIAIFIAASYMFIFMMQTPSGRQELIKETQRVKDSFK